MNHRNLTTRVSNNLLFSCIAASLIIFSPAVFAADINTDEIVITVRKTEENAQDVPVQVSAYDEQLIQRERLFSAKDIAELTPSLQFDTGFWPSDTRLSIRGLFARAGRPSAAVLIDGIDAQPRETGFARLLHELRSPVDAHGTVIFADNAELGGDDGVVAAIPDAAPDQFFIRAEPVIVRRVQQSDAQIKGAVDGLDGTRFIHFAVSGGHAHAAKADGRNLQPFVVLLATEFTGAHD